MKSISVGILILCALSFGCVQSENSSSQDSATYAASTGTAEYEAARAVLSQSCASCHNYHALPEVALIAAGLVVAGQPQESKIYYRLSGSDGSKGPKTMPSGGALSVSELNIVRNWILSIR